MLNDLFVVILNWNGWEDTKACLESLRESNCRIIIVDNGSQNDEIEQIESYCSSKYNAFYSSDREFYLSIKVNDQLEEILRSEVIIIKNNQNLGFAAGNNVGLHFLQSINAKYVLLLNNDTIVEDGAVDKMYQLLLSHKDSGAIIPQIRYYDPPNLIWNCGGKINRYGIRKYKYAFGDIAKVPQKGNEIVDYGTGCALLLNLSLTGVLTEKYFFGEEDLEFAFRLRKKGLRILCNYEAVIYHKVGSSRDQISKNAVGKMTYHYCQRISNLKDNLNLFYWIISIIIHMASSCRLLFKMRRLNIMTFYRVWREVLLCVSKEKFVLSDFITISNKTY